MKEAATNKLRLLGGVLLFALVATGFAYVIGTGFLSFRYGFNGQYLDWTWIATGYVALKNNDPQAFRIINLIWGGFIILSLLFSAQVLTDKLTTFGRADWQSRRQLRANKFGTVQLAGVMRHAERAVAARMVK